MFFCAKKWIRYGGVPARLLSTSGQTPMCVAAMGLSEGLSEGPLGACRPAGSVQPRHVTKWTPTLLLSLGGNPSSFTKQTVTSGNSFSFSEPLCFHP